MQSQITDVHLENQMKLKTSMLKSDIPMLPRQNQSQRIHLMSKKYMNDTFFLFYLFNNVVVL